jgi:hypothetical protein
MSPQRIQQSAEPRYKKERYLRKAERYHTKSQYISFWKLSQALRNITRKWKKICYAVVMSVRKLQHYFEAHRVRVLTNQPLNDIFGNRDSSGRIGKWSLELSKHIIDFEKRSAIKSYLLEDFIADWIDPLSYTEGVVVYMPWQVLYNGAWGVSGAGACWHFLATE